MNRKTRLLSGLLAAVLFFLCVPFSMAAAESSPSIKITFDKTPAKAGKPLTVSWQISGVKKPYSYVVCYLTAARSDGGQKSLLYKRGEKTMKSVKCPSVEGEQVQATVRLLAADSVTVVYEEKSDWLPVTGYTYEPVSAEFTFSPLAAQPGKPLTVSWKVSGMKDPVDFMHAYVELFFNDGGYERLGMKTDTVFFDSVTVSRIPADIRNGQILTFIWFGQNEGWNFGISAPYIPLITGQNMLVLPKGLTTVEAGAFQNGAFDVVVIPEGCTWVGERAFGSCRNLRRVVMPKGFNGFSPLAFDGCGPIYFQEVGYPDD